MANPKRPRDPNQRAKLIVDIATGESHEDKTPPEKDPCNCRAWTAGRAKGRPRQGQEAHRGETLRDCPQGRSGSLGAEMNPPPGGGGFMKLAEPGFPEPERLRLDTYASAPCTDPQYIGFGRRDLEARAGFEPANQHRARGVKPPR